MKKVTFIPSLTPLRGIAAALVVIFHFHIFIGPLLPDGNMMIDKLYLMVDLFFVLSGFIMYHVYGTWFSNSIDRGRFMDYMKARFARLYPLHILMLTYLVICASIMWMNTSPGDIPKAAGNVFDPKAIPTSILLIQAWGFHLEAPWNTASWSISVEWFLYLLFPFIIAFMTRYKSNGKWILGGSVVALLVLTMFVIEPWYTQLQAVIRGATEGGGRTLPQHTINLITGPALVRGFCGFVSGMIAYELYQQNWQKELFKKGFWFPAILVFMFAMWVGDWLPDAFTVALFAILILHTSYVEGATKKILNNKVFTYIGDISYSVYMVHIPMILTFFIYGIINGTFKNPVPGTEEVAAVVEINYLANWMGAIVFLILTIGVASLTYRFIEVPFRRKLKIALTSTSQPSIS